MKRFSGSIVLLALVLAGCNKATHVAEGKNNPPAAQEDGQSVHSVPVSFTPETRSLITPEEVPLLEQINRENIKIVAATTPSIVRVAVSKPVDPRMQFFGNDIPFQLPFGPGQHRFVQPNSNSFGSGVIISKDGYLVTNNHVIDDAKDIQVQLQDKRVFPARLVAADDMMDVAVLKIDATDLPALPWGDSDKVQVGEQVFAIGNPFDLDDSVTKGIVSAKGRNLPGSSNFEDYIQIDAAINPGNSGGALVNIHGELIGINAAIASTSRVNMGVGFAIPSNLVRYAVNGLLKEGRLVRGYLGVVLPSSIDPGVTNQLGLKTDQGALLAGIQPNAPADKAGLHPGDFITDVGEHRINSVADLRLVVAQLPVGKEVQVKYVRNGAPQETSIKIAQFAADNGLALNSNNPSDSGNGNQLAPAFRNATSNVDNVLSGLQVSDLTDKTRQKYVVDKTVGSGVVVTGSEEGSLADVKGIERGDVIESACVNRGSTQPITTAKDFTDLVKNLKPDQSVVLLVHHAKTSSFIFVSPQK